MLLWKRCNNNNCHDLHLLASLFKKYIFYFDLILDLVGGDMLDMTFVGFLILKIVLAQKLLW